METKENKYKILLVEDDPNFGSVLKDYLIIYDYDVVLGRNGVEGFEKFKKEKFDACILDVMMPYKDGFTLAREIRETDKEIPIIFLTAKTLKEDLLKGYKSGADDYLTKPFDSEVLLFKLKAIFQKNQPTPSASYSNQHEFTFGDFYFNSKLRQLRYKDEPDEILSPKENELLKLLIINKDDLMKRDHALNKIWKEGNYYTSRSMDVYIAKLRRYLKRDERIEILNVHGEGFRMVINT